MKKQKLILILLIGILIIGNANALEFEVEFYPPPCAPPDFINYQQDIIIRILIDNEDFEREYFTMPLVIYSWYNTLDTIFHIDRDGFGSTESIELSYGLIPGGFWESGIQIIERSWDGALPDSICFVAENSSAGDGWPLGQDQQYVSLHVIASQKNPMADKWLCIDSGAFFDEHNWLWENPSPPFNGPYCVGLTYWCQYPPLVIDCPTQIITLPANGEISLTLHAESDDPPQEFDWFLQYGPGTISTIGNSGVYNFVPSPEHYGNTYNVGLCVDDGWNTCPGHTSCDFPIQVSLPVCGDIVADGVCDLLDILQGIAVKYCGEPSCDDLAQELMPYGDVNSDGVFDLLDILIMIDITYGDPPQYEMDCTFSY